MRGKEYCIFSVGLMIGLMIGIIAGGIITYHRFKDWEIFDLQNEIRIKLVEMDLERIDIDELAETIKSWQQEVDEIWLFYGAGQYRTRVLDSARPSTED